MRRRIYLLRHGEVGYFDANGQPTNPKTVGLTAEGERQAIAMRDTLAGVAFDRAVCSGMRRTRETAELVLGGRDLVLEDREALREIRGGRLREMSADELAASLRRPFRDAGQPDGRYLHGERFADVERRVLDGLRALLAEPEWTQLLLVAHDVVNRLILAWAMGAPRGAIAALEQDYCCLNIIDVPLADSDAHCLVRTMNHSPRDAVKQVTRLTSLEQAFAHYRPA